ncbi:hypothetical protein J3893_001524 [Salmonella enterica subsp. enterica serovar Nigeria]|nr:hypothetical protein [Salmonella enterica subsp. enterica serovar Nigeria]
MNDIELINKAECFLRERCISFIAPPKLKRIDENIIEVIFKVPEALNPNMVIDPDDVRVRINIITGSTKLVEQM